MQFEFCWEDVPRASSHVFGDVCGEGTVDLDGRARGMGEEAGVECRSFYRKPSSWKILLKEFVSVPIRSRLR